MNKDTQEMLTAMDKFYQLLGFFQPSPKPMPKHPQYVPLRPAAQSGQTPNQPHQLTDANLRSAFTDAAKLAGKLPATPQELAAIRDRMPRNIILAEGVMQEMADTLAIIGNREGVASRYYDEDAVYDAADVLSVAKAQGYDIDEITKGAEVQHPHGKPFTLPIGKGEEAKRRAEYRAQFEANMPKIRAPRLEAAETVADLSRATKQGIRHTQKEAAQSAAEAIANKSPEQVKAAKQAWAQDFFEAAQRINDAHRQTRRDVMTDCEPQLVTKDGRLEADLHECMTLAPKLTPEDLQEYAERNAASFSDAFPAHALTELHANMGGRFDGEMAIDAEDIDRLADAVERFDAAKEHLHQAFGVREPANQLDIERAGAAAEAYAAEHYHPARVDAALAAASLDRAEATRQADNLNRANFVSLAANPYEARGDYDSDNPQDLGHAVAEQFYRDEKRTARALEYHAEQQGRGPKLAQLAKEAPEVSTFSADTIDRYLNSAEKMQAAHALEVGKSVKR